MTVLPITVFKNRTSVVSVGLGTDVSGDEFKSEIRVEQDPNSELIATWQIAFQSDGTDGELILTLDDAITGAIVHTKGYMDLKRVTGGEPISVFAPIEVVFKNPVTV